MGCGGSKSEPEGATPEEELKELHQKVLAAESKAKEEAAKTLTEQMANAKPLTGDLDGLKEAIKAAQAVKLPASELAFPLATLEEMEELHDAMNNAISQLTEVARGVDIRLGVIGLEELVAERKAPLNKFTDDEIVLYMQLMTEVPPTEVMTIKMDKMLMEAKSLGVDETVTMDFAAKNEQAKKAQNEKKLLHRKEKKPPPDTPSMVPATKAGALEQAIEEHKAWEEVEGIVLHAKVEELKQEIEEALKVAEAKLLEVKKEVKA